MSTDSSCTRMHRVSLYPLSLAAGFVIPKSISRMIFVSPSISVPDLQLSPRAHPLMCRQLEPSFEISSLIRGVPWSILLLSSLVSVLARDFPRAEGEVVLLAALRGQLKSYWSSSVIFSTGMSTALCSEEDARSRCMWLNGVSNPEI